MLPANSFAIWHASKETPFLGRQNGAALRLDVELFVKVAAVEIDGRLAEPFTPGRPSVFMRLERIQRGGRRFHAF